jgi:CHASE2 domain-containing sensor protein
MEDYLIKFWALICLSVLCGALGISYALMKQFSVYPTLSLLLTFVAIIRLLANYKGRRDKRG